MTQPLTLLRPRPPLAPLRAQPTNSPSRFPEMANGQSLSPLGQHWFHRHPLPDESLAEARHPRPLPY